MKIGFKNVNCFELGLLGESFCAFIMIVQNSRVSEEQDFCLCKEKNYHEEV
jgi:hypothetical protein